MKIRGDYMLDTIGGEKIAVPLGAGENNQTGLIRLNEVGAFLWEKLMEGTTEEDLVQDVFLKVWQKRTFLFLKEGIKTYLYRSVQHACLDYLKHQEVKGDYINAVTTKLKIEEIYYNDDPQSLFAEDERLELIYKEMDKLPDKCREIFTMSYLEERKTSEIAVLLNISTRTVEAQLYKALKILRGILLSCLIFLSNF